MRLGVLIEKALLCKKIRHDIWLSSIRCCLKCRHCVTSSPIPLPYLMRAYRGKNHVHTVHGMYTIQSNESFSIRIEHLHFLLSTPPHIRTCSHFIRRHTVNVIDVLMKLKRISNELIGGMGKLEILSKWLRNAK